MQIANDQKDIMRVITFNVNSLRVRLPVVMECLRLHRPDALCLQETKVQDHDFPKDDFDAEGYNYVFKGEKTYNGVAVISPHEIKNVRFGLAEEPKDSSRLIKADIKGVSIVNTYVPQGAFLESKKYQYKLDWFQRLGRFFKENFEPDEPLVWVGDMNVAPNEADLWNPEGNREHVCFHEDVRKAFSNVVQLGFVDVFRKHCDQPGQYSFWDYRQRGSVERNRGWRLDHILATKPLADKSKSCFIDKQPRLGQRPSDHTPVIAEFDLG